MFVKCRHLVIPYLLKLFLYSTKSIEIPLKSNNEMRGKLYNQGYILVSINPQVNYKLVERIKNFACDTSYFLDEGKQTCIRHRKPEIIYPLKTNRPHKKFKQDKTIDN